MFGRPVDAAAVRASRSTLYRFLDQVGGDGVDTTGTLPGVLAVVDQHAAAIRDVLGPRGGTPGLVSLAGYAEGLLDTAAESGWLPPSAATVDWSVAGWLLVRLRAVCALACTTGYL